MKGGQDWGKAPHRDFPDGSALPWRATGTGSLGSEREDQQIPLGSSREEPGAAQSRGESGVSLREAISGIRRSPKDSPKQRQDLLPLGEWCRTHYQDSLVC